MKLNFKKFCLAFKPKINFTFTKMKDYLIFFLVFVYVCKYRGAQFVGISEYFLIANFLQKTPTENMDGHFKFSCE